MRKTKIHIDKIYTKAGDQGHTSIIGEKKLISKACDRVEGYGSIDELLSHVGLALSLMEQHQKDFPDVKSWERNFFCLKRIQNNLFDLGSLVATAPQSTSSKTFSHDRVTFLEEAIDMLQPKLPALDSFVLPGGHILNAQFHVCRTVCRRVERRLVKLGENEAILQGDVVIQYINRLSDLFFALSRWISVELKEKEVLWEPGQ